MAPRVQNAATALALVALAATSALTGCVSPSPAPGHADLARVVEDTAPMTWAEGNWWGYEATLRNTTLQIALIVAHRADDGFLLGTNQSAGFFGLPFHGNVTPDLNPLIGPDEWPLYRFPLADGKSWDYQLFGYDARATARAALIDVPGVGPSPGFTIEASSFGRVFARYDYAPTPGWFTRLTLHDAARGDVLLDVRLLDYGPAYGEGYYVEKTLQELRIDYPAVPGAIELQIPRDYPRIDAHLTAATQIGLAEARLVDDDGRPIAKARALAKGADVAHASAERATTWTLHHQGVGPGVIHLALTGIVPVGGAAPPTAPRLEADTLTSALQSTLPARPHTGHVTSTGLPVAV